MNNNLDLAAILLLFITTTTHASVVPTSGVFGMSPPDGAITGADPTIMGFVDQNSGTWGMSSTSPYWGLTWTAHDGVIYGSGAYSIDTIEGGILNASVNTNQIGGHILWDLGSVKNMDFFIVWDINANGSLSYASSPGMVDGASPGFHPWVNFTSDGLVSPVPIPASGWLMTIGITLLLGAQRKRLTSHSS